MSSKLSFSEAGKLGHKASAPARIKLKNERRAAYTANPKQCQYCNEPLPYEQRANKFCSKSHAASFNNEGIRRHGLGRAEQAKIQPSKIATECLHCAAPLIAMHKRKFCSAKCQGHYRHGLWIKQVDSTGIFPWVAAQARQYLVNKFGHSCSICLTKEWLGKPVPLVMDHSNGNPADNRVANIRLVCGNCDMQLPTYKSKNKGHGRHSRRVRYRNNQSY